MIQGGETAGDLDAESEATAAYAEFELEVLHHAIVVADAKASFVLGIALAAAAAAFQPTVKAIHTHELLRAILGVAGEAAMLVSGVAGYLTVAPRIVGKTITSNTYWAGAIFKGPLEAYVTHIQRLSVAELEATTLSHLHISARICRQKYQRLLCSIYVAPVGLALLALAYLAGPTG